MRHERGRPPHPDLLTPAERRVLEELREGRPNAEIAVRLGVSVNTVRYHVSNMLGKLELPNRTALRSWDGKPRREWGWLGMWGFRFGSGFSAAGKLALLVGVATVGAGLLVVGSGRVTLPSMVEEAPVASSVGVEPQDVAGEVGDVAALRPAAVVLRDGQTVRLCVDVSVMQVSAGSTTRLTPLEYLLLDRHSAFGEVTEVRERGVPGCPPVASVGPLP